MKTRDALPAVNHVRQEFQQVANSCAKNRHLIPVLFGVWILGCAILLSASAVQAATNTFKIAVTSGEDNNVRDGDVTLCEALLISEGKLLKKDLDPREARNVEITPSLLERHFISLGVQRITLKPKQQGPLPDITANGTRIASVVANASTNPTVIDGNGLAVCFNAKAFRFEVKNVEFINCDKSVNEDVSNATPDDDITVIIGPAKISKGKDGIQFVGPKNVRAGNGKQVVQLLDLEMNKLSGLPLSLAASEGVVEVHRSRFETQGEVTIQADLGDGTGDLEFNFFDNMIFLKDGKDGMHLAEHQQSGKLNYHLKGNYWDGGKVQVDATIGAEGSKISELNTYLNAKVAVQQRFEAFSSGTITVQAQAETFIKNKIANHTEIISGFIEYSSQLCKFENNGTALDWFIRATARGSLHSRNDSARGSLQIGVRIIGEPGGSGFDLFFEKDVFGDGRLGGHLREFPNSISISNSSFTNNQANGLELVKSHATIASSRFTENNGTGLEVSDASHVEIKNSQFVKNGKHGLASSDSQLEVADSTLDSNKKNGLNLKKSVSTITGSDISNNKGNGLEHTDLKLEVQNSTILFNGKNGVAIDQSPAVVQTSLICFNKQDGVNVQGDSDVNASTDIIDQNGAYEVRNLSPNYLSAVSNGWGPITADEMNRKPYPSNISVIFDVFDDPSKGFVEYAGWSSEGCTPTTSTPTPTATPTATATETATSIVTPTRTRTPTTTSPSSPTRTLTSVPSSTPPSTVTPSRTNTPMPTKTATNVPTPSSTPSQTNTPFPTSTRTNTPVPTLTLTSTATNTATSAPTTTTGTPATTGTPSS